MYVTNYTVDPGRVLYTMLHVHRNSSRVQSDDMS